MGRQVGGIIGAVIGAVAAYYTGDYELIALGYSLGSGAQALIAPPHTYGPTINDLKIQTAGYGVDIPERWGEGRQAVEVLWITDLIPSTVDVSSKGGATQTNQKLNFHVALGLGVGPIIGIGRIWANKKVWGDFRPVNTSPENDPRLGQVRVYLGDETQLADPLIEAISGPGTPGYRGLAYIVLEGVDGTDTQGRIQWEVEVIADGTTAVHYQNIATLTSSDQGDDVPGRAWISLDKIYWWRSYLHDSRAALYRSIDGGPAEYIGDLGFQTGSDLVPVNSPSMPVYATPFRRLSPITDGGVERMVLQVSFLENTHVTRYLLNQTPFSSYTSLVGSNAHLVLAYDEDSDVTSISSREARTGITDHFFAERITLMIGGTPIIGGIPPQVIAYDDLPRGEHVLASNEICCGLANRDDQVFALIWDATTFRLRILSEDDASVLEDFVGPAAGGPSFGAGVQESIRVDGNRVYAWCATTGLAWRWDLPAGTFVILADGIGVLNDSGGVTTALGGNMVYIDDTSMINQSEAGLQAGGPSVIFRIEKATFNAPTGAGVPLPTIVADICAEAGLSSSDIDVSLLPTTPVSYTRTKQMTARAAIEPLQQAFFFDAVESNFKLKFVPRGGSVAITIPFDDRAAHVAGEDMPDHLKIVRAAELEQQSQVDVEYIDPLQDYLTGDQYERRLTKAVDSSVTVSLPINMTADQAKQTAASTLYQSWLFMTFQFSTTRKYAQIEPTDVVSLPTENATYVARITKKTEQPNGIIDWEAQQEDAAVYSQTLSGTTTSYVPATLKTVPRTDLELLDIPILQDADNDSGAYAKLTPVADDWPGGSLTKNDGGTPTVIASATKVSTVGVALTALPDYAGRLTSFDESGTVDILINIGAPTPLSVTPAQAYGGANAFLIGNGVAGQEEIIVACNMTLIGTRTYRLSRLLRYQRDTLGAKGFHAIGDRVVALEKAGLIRFNNGLGDIGIPHKYSATTFGRQFSANDQQTFTNTGIGLKPFRPLHLGAGKDGSGNVLFKWVPQTRLDATLRDSVTQVNGETTENYSLDIATTSDFSTIVRTINTTNPAATYAAADITTDHAAGLLNPFFWRVRQVSAQVGYGNASSTKSFTT